MTNNKPLWRWYGSRDGEEYYDLPDGVSTVVSMALRRALRTAVES